MNGSSVTIIHACNDAIANLHKADMSVINWRVTNAANHFLRAWAYNRLNMLYQGIPHLWSPSITKTVPVVNLR